MNGCDDGVSIEMITLLKFSNGTMWNEFIWPAKFQICANRLAEAAHNRPVLNSDDFPPSGPLPL